MKRPRVISRHNANGGNARRDDLRFSLIELLVAIAILSAVLLPALGKARDTAKRIVCAGNLKNVNATEMYYVDDYNGYFTPAIPGTDGNGDNIYWPNLLNPYLGGKDVSHADFQKTVKTFNCLWYCPVQVPYYGTYVANERYLSYAINQYLSHKNATTIFSVKINKIAATSKVCVFMDSFDSNSTIGAWGYFFSAWSRLAGRHPRKGPPDMGGCDFAWVDGHISSLNVSAAWSQGNWEFGADISGSTLIK